MYILFEEHPYDSHLVEEVLKDIYVLQDIDKNVSVQYVGYFYNPHLHDCVFILPKVLLTENETLVGITLKTEEGEKEVTPEMVITPKDQERLSKEYRKFIYEFSVWIYRALNVFYKSNPKSKAILYKRLPQAGKGRRHRAETYLDIVLSLIDFNRDNRDFILFTIKNLHRGNNKINWTRTIGHSQGFVQDKEVVYLNPVNKKRVVNYEEELFIIFFSILNYLNLNYGFNTPINIQYELIQGKQFQQYLRGMGKTRLMQIKYKYFSDKALQLWDLCYAFFENSYRIAINTHAQEYILAKSFNVVFEAMIDELIGTPHNNIPKGLADQPDGKRVDHMYTYEGLTISNDQHEEIYYIGDSKYYKLNTHLGKKDIYKQFTYARNVIQWNIDLFVNGKNDSWKKDADFKYDQDKFKKIKLRNDESDPLTEGYNVLPNFFISAFVDKQLRYNDGKNIRNLTEDVDGKEVHKTYISTQFNDRLFDRDTLILSQYDVNFLYILFLYARNKQNEKAAWKREVRNIFRDEIRKVLIEHYDFYALKSKGNPLAGEEFIKEHFKELQGKLYRPYSDKNIYSLALEKQKHKATKDSEEYRMLEEFFEVKEIKELGDNPQQKLEELVETYQKAHPYDPKPENWLPEYHVERYLDHNFVIGMYYDQKHWDWINGKNDRDILMYNVRYGNRTGALNEDFVKVIKPRFVILYEKGHEVENKYHVFLVRDTFVMSEKEMRQSKYPRKPQDNYYIFQLEEEVTIGRFDINKYLADKRNELGLSSGKKRPFFPTGEELLKYRLPSVPFLYR